MIFCPFRLDLKNCHSNSFQFFKYRVINKFCHLQIKVDSKWSKYKYLMTFNRNILSQGCIIRLLTLDALQCTENIVSLAKIDIYR